MFSPKKNYFSKIWYFVWNEISQRIWDFSKYVLKQKKELFLLCELKWGLWRVKQGNVYQFHIMYSKYGFVRWRMEAAENKFPLSLYQNILLNEIDCNLDKRIQTHIPLCKEIPNFWRWRRVRLAEIAYPEKQQRISMTSYNVSNLFLNFSHIWRKLNSRNGINYWIVAF